jgi:hypothetical protein
MDKSFFEVGKTYGITKKDWESPDGEVIKGNFFIKKILEDASKANSRKDACEFELKNWSKFLRVQGEDGRVNLLSPDTIESAYVLEVK